MKSLSKPTKVILAIVLLITLGLITLGSYSYYNSVKVDWSKTKDVFDVLKNVATILAVLIGAIWAYFNFFKGRTYRSRLELNVGGKLIFRDGSNFLIVTAQLKNVGLSDVSITQKGSALRVFAYACGEGASKACTVEQTRLITLPVFERHGWIEPGELIDDQRFIALPDMKYLALQLTLRIISNEIEWNSAAIIEPPELTNGSNVQSQIKANGPSPGQPDAEPKEPKDGIEAVMDTTEDLAGAKMEKKEDAGESQRIEAEKKTFADTIS